VPGRASLRTSRRRACPGPWHGWSCCTHTHAHTHARTRTRTYTHVVYITKVFSMKGEGVGYVYTESHLYNLYIYDQGCL
jgi:hypothetical protein